MLYCLSLLCNYIFYLEYSSLYIINRLNRHENISKNNVPNTHPLWCEFTNHLVALMKNNGKYFIDKITKTATTIKIICSNLRVTMKYAITIATNKAPKTQGDTNIPRNAPIKELIITLNFFRSFAFLFN